MIIMIIINNNIKADIYIYIYIYICFYSIINNYFYHNIIYI